jgi:predicted DNA-binding transcriptional regulator AlpA
MPNPEMAVQAEHCRENRMGTENTIEKLLHERDIARITGMSLASVRRWRLRRLGPRFLKIGSAVRYRIEDVAEWLQSRPCGGSTVEKR